MVKNAVFAAWAALAVASAGDAAQAQDVRPKCPEQIDAKVRAFSYAARSTAERLAEIDREVQATGTVVQLRVPSAQRQAATADNIPPLMLAGAYVRAAAETLKAEITGQPGLVGGPARAAYEEARQAFADLTLVAEPDTETTILDAMTRSGRNMTSPAGVAVTATLSELKAAEAAATALLRDERRLRLRLDALAAGDPARPAAEAAYHQAVTGQYATKKRTEDAARTTLTALNRFLGETRYAVEPRCPAAPRS